MSGAATSSSAARDRLPELDLLRFGAALAVAFYHLCKWPEGAAAVQRVTELGFLGVQVFFVISGFVILMTAEHRSPLEFAKSRIARLYPTFWICVLVTSLALALHHEPPSPARIAANLTMLPPLFRQEFIDPVYWTLVMELRFYGLVLFILLLRQMRRLELWLGAWVAILLLTRLPIETLVPPRLLHALSFLALGDYGSLFAAGCYFYLVRSRGLSLSRLAPLLICLALAVEAVCRAQDGSRYPWNAVQIAAMGVTVFLTFAVFFALALRQWRLPTSPAWYWIGGLTYPLYLIHAQTGRLLWLALPGSGWARSAQVLIFSLLAAALLARYSERRACRALHAALDRAEDSLRARLRGPASRAAAVEPATPDTK